MAVTRSAAKKTVPVDRNTSQLSMFVWEGTDKRGVKMKGEQQSKSMNLLRAELRRMGITPTVVKPKPKPLFGAAGKVITPKEIAFFSRQMATMMKSGVPIVQSLEIIGGGHKNPRMKGMIDQIRTEKTPAIFMENITDPRLIEQIARETGTKIGGTVYSDALSPADGPAPTYLDMMNNNISMFAAALK